MFNTLRNQWKKAALAVISQLVVTAVVTSFVTKQHWWRRLAEARVNYNNNPSSESRVYRSGNGDLLVVIGEEGPGSLYIVHTGTATIRMPNVSSFVLLPGYAHSRQIPVPEVSMKSVKIEGDAQLIIHPGVIEFSSIDSCRVRISP